MSTKRKGRTPESGKEPLLADKPPATNRAFGALLKILGLDQTQAAQTLHMEAGSISEYTRKKTLHLSNYRRKCAALGVEAVGEKLLTLAAEVDGGAEIHKATPTLTGVITEFGRLAEHLAASLPAKARDLAAEEDRQRLQSLWRDFRKLTLAEWRLLVAAAPELRRWAFVKLVGEESARAATVDAKRALELARFALWVAERVSGEEAWASRVFGWAILGNARRVEGDLAGAKEAFARSARLQAEQPEGGAELFEPWRLLDLEASLRITLRQLPEALRLLDQAAEVAPRSGPIRARILCKRSIALDRIGDPQGSIAVLREALVQIEPDAEPDLYCLLQSNLADTLTSVGQHAEAAEMLPALRRMQAQIGDGLNQIRLRWLEGKIDAGLGRLDRAIEALSWVRAAFAGKDLRYDEAQAGMDLAGLYLKQGRTAEVKRLVLQMAPVFKAQDVPVEAKKALDLFRRAVETEAATPELAGRVAGYLRRAQHDPELRFEMAA